MRLKNNSQKITDWLTQVQILVGEIAKVEEEIIYLEKKVEEMKLTLHQERKYKKECQLQWEEKLQRRHRRASGRSHGVIQRPPNMEEINQIPFSERNPSSTELVAEAKALHHKKISGHHLFSRFLLFQYPYELLNSERLTTFFFPSFC